MKTALAIVIWSLFVIIAICCYEMYKKVFPEDIKIEWLICLLAATGIALSIVIINC